MSDRRDQQLHFRVSKPELERIRNKMEASGILSIGSYLRKMALDGYCLYLAGRFVKNFAKYEGNEHGKALVSAGPQL